MPWKVGVVWYRGQRPRGALILLQTCTSDDNRALIFTPGAFKVSNHYSSLNLIGHIHIPTCATETVQQWPDPPFPALVMQYIQSWEGSGLVHETKVIPRESPGPSRATNFKAGAGNEAFLSSCMISLPGTQISPFI